MYGYGGEEIGRMSSRSASVGLAGQGMPGVYIRGMPDMRMPGLMRCHRPDWGHAWCVLWCLSNSRGLVRGMPGV